MDIYRRKLAVAIEVIAGELKRDELLVAKGEAGEEPFWVIEPTRNHAYGLRLALSSLSGIIEGYDSPSEPPHIRAINWSRRVLGEEVP